MQGFFVRQYQVIKTYSFIFCWSRKLQHFRRSFFQQKNSATLPWQNLNNFSIKFIRTWWQGADNKWRKSVKNWPIGRCHKMNHLSELSNREAVITTWWALLVFEIQGQFLRKKFPRTPHETCNSGSRWTTLLEYENRIPQIVCHRCNRHCWKNVWKKGKTNLMHF